MIGRRSFLSGAAFFGAEGAASAQLFGRRAGFRFFGALNTVTAPLTDFTKVIPQVAAPTPPAKGNVFFDPTFSNVPILRLTDATDGVGDEYPDYSYWGSFNLHEKLVILLTSSGSGTTFIELNPDSFTAVATSVALTRYNIASLLGKYVEGTWSPTIPNYMYAPANAGNGPKICRLDMTNRSSPTEITYDFTGKTASGQTVLATDYFGQMIMAADEDTFSASWFDSGYNTKGIVVGRLSTLALLYALADTTIDECNITRDGLYLHATWGPPGQTGTGYRNLEIKISDGTSQGFVDNSTSLSVGHHVAYGSGNGLLGYQDSVNQLLTYNLSSPATKTVVWDYGANFSLGDIHLSTTAMDQTYALVSEEQQASDNTALPLVGELWLVKLDGSKTGLRLARHYSMQPSGGDYYSQTRANLSPSRRFVIGSSNMGQPTGRKDAYVWFIGAAFPGQDFIPNAFSFTPVTGATVSTVYTAASFTVSGLGATDSSFIIPTGGGSYSKNSGAYTTTRGTVVNGDVISFQVTSSASANTAVNAALNIGGIMATFTVTTAASANLVTATKTASPAIADPEYAGATYTFAAQSIAANATEATKDRVVLVALSTAGMTTGTFSCLIGGKLAIPVAQSGAYTPASGKAVSTLLGRRVLGSENLQTADIVISTNAFSTAVKFDAVSCDIYSVINSSTLPSRSAVQASTTANPSVPITVDTEGLAFVAMTKDINTALSPSGISLDVDRGLNTTGGNAERMGTGVLSASATVALTTGGQTSAVASASYKHVPTTKALDYVGVSAVATVASGTITLTEPANAQQGDLLVAQIAARDVAAFTLPSGWTLIAQNSTGNTTVGATGSIASGLMAYAIRGASAPSYAFTRTGGDVAIGAVVCARPESGGTVSLDQSANATLATASATVSVAGFTTTQAYDLVVMGGALARNVTSSAEKAATQPNQNDVLEVVDGGTATGAGAAVMMAYGYAPAAAATGTLQYTTTSARHGIYVAAFKVT